MKITVIGTGYVGLVSGACFADFGHVVTCVDKNADKINALKNRKIPIYEPGLKKLVRKNAGAGRLEFTMETEAAVKSADAVFIAVGTPARRGDGHADLTYVYEASKEIARALDGFTVVVTKSTVPVGTGDKVEEIIRETNPKAEFAVVSNPEFLREGAAISDFKRPDRIVVGTEDPRAVKVMDELYRPLFLNQTPILYTSRRSSELIKYASNAFLATKITFINEMADLCEQVGANVQDISRGMGFDGRIGPKFLHAGPGYGGSCFPKDTKALAQTASETATPLKIVNAVIEANAERKRAMADKVIAAIGGDVSGKKIGVLGLAFKPNTDDMRDAPSLDIIPVLVEHGATIKAYDPKSMKEAKEIFKELLKEQLSGLTFSKTADDAIKDVDAIVIITEWDEFRALDIQKVKVLMKGKTVIDLRNIYRPSYMAAHGFDYVSVGRPQI